MKFITIILSVYILGLSFVTCNDNEIHVTQENDIENILEVDQHQDSGETDLCSPFCSCQCCQISIVNIDLEVYNLLKEDYFGTVYNTYENNYLKNFAHSLFQPPRA